MDKNAIKKYAVWARTELITRVSQRAEKYDISAEADVNASSVNGILLSDAEKKQRKALIEQVKQKGFDQVMEEVAYTWFNRFIALRFMEVNGYLPSHIRVFTDDNNNFKPQILAEAIHLELDDLDMDKVYEMKNNNENDELYKYLIITQCNELSKVLPEMFQKIADYTELLFPDNILREGSVIEQMVVQIDENDWNVSNGGQIEILGWLYQYYISEKHESVVNAIGKKEIQKEDIPAATALFTTDWVVRYIVDNSVGRYWIERNPDSLLKDELLYYVSPSVDEDKTYEKISPQQLTVFDPSMGSAHFGIYTFEVLVKIYTECGYTEREAAAEIVRFNLFGLDIDNRSAQIANFAIIMKAMQYDRRFLIKGIQPNYYCIEESNNIDPQVLSYFENDNDSIKKEIELVIKELHDAKEYGSILEMEKVNLEILEKRIQEVKADISFYRESVIEQIQPLINTVKLLTKKYAVVATNPPYMNKYDAKLKKYVLDKYKDYSGDLFSVFMYHNFEFCLPDGYSGFMTPNVWMFIISYEKLRRYIISTKSVATLVQMAKGAFFKEAAVDVCAFVLKNSKDNSRGMYIRLEDFHGDMEVQNKAFLSVIHGENQRYLFERGINDFLRIEDSPFAYWCTEKLYRIFENSPNMAQVSAPRVGLQTGDNAAFLRYWFEVSKDKTCFDADSNENAVKSGCKWFPYNKGGAFRRWYGNRDYVVNWQNDGYEIKNFKDDKGKVRSRPQNRQFYFKPSITWSDITSGSFSGRYSNQGSIFDVQGSSSFPDENILFYLLGFMNSSVSQEVLKMLNPTLHTQVGDLSRLPIVIDDERKQKIDMLVKDCVNNARDDWNSSENSWDYTQPLIKFKSGSLRTDYELLEKEQKSRFQRQKENEVEINRLFIEIYGLESEMNPEIDDDNITLRKPDAKRDIKEFLSFAIGCMFGRYSLDRSGLVYAGGSWDESAYERFLPDKDAIIPITDDEYFSDDVVGRLEEFLIALYGNQSLEDNLKFIAESLGGKGSARSVIREYFINDFFAYHCNMCSVTGSGKRPFYWLFDSGKKNGFKCLIYMHRYQADTIARIRTDYVHEQQSRYRTAIEETENRLLSAEGSDKVKLNKKLKHLKEQDAEIYAYEEKIHHLADQMISIDLDDGVKTNYAKFQDVLARIK